MARTKASVGAKVSSGKSSKARCNAAPPTAVHLGSGERSSRGPSGGGNPVCPRETPKWQRPITNFFNTGNAPRRLSDSNSDDGASASTSRPKQKRNIIESDEEDAPAAIVERPKNTVLDETLELDPLTGEDSHKIDEYYSANVENAITDQVNGVTGKANRVSGKENRIIDEQNGVADKENGVSNKENGVADKENGVSNKENGVADNENGVAEKGKWKGKGKGKKTNKENVDSNIEKRKSVKRDLEEVTVGEEVEHESKKVKVN